MTVEFRFINGTSQIYITPTTEREKSMVRMFREGVTSSDQIRIVASNSPDTLVLQAEIVIVKKDSADVITRRGLSD